MDRQAAVKIIQDTFEKSFDKVQFINFSKNLVNYLNTSKNFTYQGNLIPDAYERSIQSLERIGKYEDAVGNKIDVLIVRLKKEYALERARTMQRNFVAWYLNGSRGGDLKDAALAAFVSPGDRDWRFSLVRMDYNIVESPSGKIKVETELTPARRYSFIVGENESSHTAQVQLLPILEDDRSNPVLSDLEKAFSIEVVTKEFFSKYRELFHKVEEALQAIVKQDKRIREDFSAKGVDTVNFSKKLLGQVVFLYFLQKKGWFGVGRDEDWGTGPKDFLRRLFEKKIAAYSNFFNDVLEPLFYEALAVERTEDFYSRFNCKIPFLNGGLFDPINNYDWVHTDILLPNKLFSNTDKTKEGDTGTGILDVFDRYNFTVKEDEPLDKEVAVDPEMLGKVFENLLEVKDRKSKGTYYTPREIVHYMCQESLINYLDTAINTGDAPLVQTRPPQGKLFGQPDPEQGALKTAAYKVLVPREEIEAFVRMGELAIEHDTRVETYGKETERYSYRLPESIRRNAKLIDEKLANIRVCDPAIGSGAFPVGLMAEIVRARNTLTTYLADEEERTNYNFKRHAIQNCLYGVDIDLGAVEIAKLRLWLSLIVDEEDYHTIKPLPSLDYKIVCGNSLLGVERNLFNLDSFKELEQLKPLYFNETNAGKKQKYTNHIEKLIRQLTNNNKDFDFEVYFSEVFHDKAGFDVVIANPPYGSVFSKNEMDFVEKKYRQFRSQTKNSAIYFIYKARELAHDKGVISYIVPKSLCYSMGWNRCASVTIDGLKKLIDTGKAFDEVKLEQVIFIRTIWAKDAIYINGIYDGNEIKEFAKVNKGVFREHKVLLTGQAPEEMKIIEKIISKFKKGWSDYVSIERGLNWQSQVKHKRGRVPIYRGAQLSPYFLDKATDFIDITKFKRGTYEYQLRPKILNQLAIAHVQNPYPHFYLQAVLDLDSKLVFETISCTFVKNNSVSIKFLLAVNNSKLFAWLLYKFVYSNAIRSTRYDEQYVGKVPCPDFEKLDQRPLTHLVDHILSITGHEDYLTSTAKQAKVKEYQRQIDHIVYQLYGLTPEEIEIVDRGRKE